MEENIKGKKPIKIIEEDKLADKKEIKDNNSGFVKGSKKTLWIIISIFILICVFLLINYIPADIERIKDSVVMIKTYDKDGNELGNGSGFCVFKENYIVTNFHVIEGAYSIEILTDSNRTYKANEVLIFNQNDDLAILSGNFKLKPLKIGSKSNLKAGKEVIAIGSPKGHLNTVSTGVISNADDKYQIRITAPISPRK